MAKGCKKISFSADYVVPGLTKHSHFEYREPSIVIDAEMYYKLKYCRRYAHLNSMSLKLRTYIEDLRDGEERL